MNLRVVCLLAWAASCLCSNGVAGEPIRFVRPKAGEKAPLRFNFAVEKIQSRASLSESSLRSDSAGGPSMSGSGGVLVNRKARSRRGWDSAGPESSATEPRPDPGAGWSDDLDPGSRAEDSPLLGQRDLIPRGFGVSPGPASLGERVPGYGSDNRSTLRSMMGETFGNPGIPGNPGGSRNVGLRGGAFSGTGGAGLGFGAGGTIPGGAPIDGGRVDPALSSGLAPRSGFDAASRVDSRLDNRILTPPPESRRGGFDPSDRPLRSNFELPTRPR